MKAFLRHAEEILDIASAGNGEAGDMAIVVGHEGGMRMVEPRGWSLTALCAEFGAPAAYKVERRGCIVRVEGWSGGERCLLQRATGLRHGALFSSSPLCCRLTA
jgi:hypothetical protein